VRSFAPIAGRGARVLILGSMPGVASLQANRYYAHPHNAFWPILGQLLGFDPRASYAKRVAALKAARIAVWDVLHSCEREGSLDARIREEVANDFAAFHLAHPQLKHVFFNGAKAETSYRKLVPQEIRRGLHFRRLPSSSPAHAALSMKRKLAAWRAILEAGEPT